ncbi:MAG: HAD-IA family hydrolase [Ignavibacteriales bacterium]|nr:HAD-IA family hydrolase [Ignavibacteriales bacterium]
MNINLVVFDLDGTLISSHKTIYKATLHALREINIYPKMPEEDFYKTIGMHFEDIFTQFGFSVPDFEKFINIYKSIYFDYIDLSVVYPGVNEIINKLQRKNIKTALLTTKGQDHAERILSHFKLFDKFDYVMGRRPGIAHKPSPEPLLKICNDLNIDIAETLIVGDSELDVQCGKNADSKTCAVTYGYRTAEELKKEFPDFIIDNILDVDYIVSR